MIPSEISPIPSDEPIQPAEFDYLSIDSLIPLSMRGRDYRLVGYGPLPEDSMWICEVNCPASKLQDFLKVSSALFLILMRNSQMKGFESFRPGKNC
jgi:hypothetical protein